MTTFWGPFGYIKENIELERKTKNFWAKSRKLMGAEFSDKFEENPTDTTIIDEFKSNLTELMNRQNVKMSVVVFLYNLGIEIP